MHIEETTLHCRIPVPPAAETRTMDLDVYTA
jgi:hypothetical protein